MQLVLMIFINIVMFAVFYLIITLKLERSATQFREQKMRKIMDEIIKEFNEISERNISILENRIAVARRILEASGKLKTVNLQVGDVDGDVKNNNAKEESVSRSAESRGNDTRAAAMSSDFKLKRIDEDTEKTAGTNTSLKDTFKNAASDMFGLMKEIASDTIAMRSRIISKRTSPSGDIEQGDAGAFSQAAAPGIKSAVKEAESNSTKTESASPQQLVEESDERDGMMDERELGELFDIAENKYSLVSNLYTQGYSVDVISRSSGIPVGEVRLVLNLNNS